MRAKGFGIMKRSQVSMYQACRAAHAIGTSGAPPIRAMSTVPVLTWKRGPTGPSEVVTIETPRFIVCCASLMTSAPVWAAALLVEAGHTVGHVSYVDRHAGLLEVVVELVDHGACSVLLSLQGRATGQTEAFCTVEPLAGGPPPPVDAVAELLAEGLRAVAAR